MAYMNQEKKAKIKAELDTVLKGTGIKYSLGVRNHSTIVLNIKSGPVDFIGNYNSSDRNAALHRSGQIKLANQYIDVNPYWFKDHFTGEVKELLIKVFAALNNGNHDNSDSQSDYFDVGWYVDVNIGKWDSPYIYTK